MSHPVVNSRRAPRPRLLVARWAPPVIAVLAVLAFWQAAVTVGLLDETYFPSMTSTLSSLVGLVIDVSFWNALFNTLLGAFVGLLIAIVIGIALGTAIGNSEWLYRALRVPVEFLRPMPSVALIPVAVLILGTGIESKVFLVAFASLWPILIQTIYGMHDTDRVVVETARSFRVGRVDRFLRIKLPAALPYIVTGVRISAAVSLILAVTAELLLGSQGLGREINIARAGGALALMYALIIASGCLGLAVNGVTRVAETRLLRWHSSQRGDAA